MSTMDPEQRKRAIYKVKRKFFPGLTIGQINWERYCYAADLYDVLVGDPNSATDERKKFLRECGVLK